MSDDIHSLVGAYAVDAVDDAERARFEAHLADCAECRAEVDSLRSAASSVSAIADTPPPASLKAALMRDIRSVRPLPPLVADQEQDQDRDQPSAQDPGQAQDRQPSGPAAGPGTDAPVPGHDELHARRERRTGSHNRVTRWLAGAAAAAAIVVGGVVWHPWDTGTSQAPVSASQQVLQAGDARSYTDRSTTIVRSASLGKAVVRATLPPPPAGKVYELWLQRPDGTMAKAGLVSDVTGVRDGVVLQGDAATATGAGITLEPAGGSDAPTTTPLALVSFT
jgi:anti-sigma factor RsiW